MNRIFALLGAVLAWAAVSLVAPSVAQAAPAWPISPSSAQAYNECFSQGYITVRTSGANGAVGTRNLNGCGWAGGTSSENVRLAWITPGWCFNYGYLGGGSGYIVNGNAGPARWVDIFVEGYQTKIYLYRC